jgi:hypothetical protein
MRIFATLAASAAAIALAAPAEAQDRNRRQVGPGQSTPLAMQAMQGSDQPDVLLDIPNLSVDEINLEVNNLQVNIALDADNNPQLVTQLLSTVDNTVNTVGGVANNAVGTVGGVAGNLLRNGTVLDLGRTGLTELGRTVNGAGNLVRRVRDNGGRLFEVVTDNAGRILSSRPLSQ